ncbi:MAG: hypothetical protein JW941_09005 [Candidatus Coatesbacteria bacterium]|nr:hypothetical protein [Candidatus Coatesbacteria bacterium]
MQRELRAKLEGILSILDGLAPARVHEEKDSATEGRDEAVPENLGESLSALKLLGDSRQTLNEMGSACDRLLSEYEEFVGNCQDDDKLTKDEKYQMAADFFSFLVGESAKNHKKAGLVEKDLGKISELLRGQGESTGREFDAKPDIAKEVKKARQAVMELAAYLSVDMTGPSD